MTPSEMETLAKSIEILSKVIGTIGFPVVVSLYLLLGLPRHLDRIMGAHKESTKSLTIAIDGMRSDVQELSGLLKYEARLRGYEVVNRRRRDEEEEEKRVRESKQSC